MSTYNSLLAQTQTTSQGLGFTWGQNNAPVPVVVASQPVARETLEQPLPVIAVTLTVPEDVKQGATGNYMDVIYRAQISVIAGGNASFETNLPTYLGWRESLRKAFQRIVIPTIPQMYMVDVVAKETLSRELQRDNYDFSILQIDYHVLEQATN